MFKRILIAASLCLAASAPVWSQAGQFPSGYVQSNAGASAGQGKPNAVTAILDRALGSTRGAIIERGSTGWGIIGPSATAGLPWLSGGTGADPGYAVLQLVGGGTGCSTASGACLDNITGFSATTGYLTRTGSGTYSFSFPAFSQITGSASAAQIPNLSGLNGSITCSQEPARTGVVTASAGSCANAYPNANANTVLSNWGASAAAPIFNTWPACANDGAHALVYVNGTGLVCATLSTGGTVTSLTSGNGISLSPSTITTTGSITCSAATSSAIGCQKQGAAFFSTLSNSTQIGSGSTVMVGNGGTCQITPRTTGVVSLHISGEQSNTGAGASTSVSLRYGLVSGGVPGINAAATGTQLGQVISQISTAVGQNVFFNVGGQANLTVGSAYWFDDTQSASANNVQISQQACEGMEIN